MIQELKGNEASLKQRAFEAEEKQRKSEVEFQTSRREMLNANESFKRLQENYKDSIHKNNLYKIEMEELIKQIDLADAKSRQSEDELKLAQAEYERKLKQTEDRILFRRSKQDEREVYELKRVHAIEKEELQKKLDEKTEELDYYTQKSTKLESDNRNLRVLGVAQSSNKESNQKMQALEDEIVVLKSQLSSNQQILQENINLKNIKNDLSKEEQVKLQKELQQLEIMVRGYQDDSEKSLQKIKSLETTLK